VRVGTKRRRPPESDGRIPPRLRGGGGQNGLSVLFDCVAVLLVNHLGILVSVAVESLYPFECLRGGFGHPAIPRNLVNDRQMLGPQRDIHLTIVGFVGTGLAIFTKSSFLTVD
jgi:hypothetical protein